MFTCTRSTNNSNLMTKYFSRHKLMQQKYKCCWIEQIQYNGGICRKTFMTRLILFILILFMYIVLLSYRLYSFASCLLLLHSGGTTHKNIITIHFLITVPRTRDHGYIFLHLETFYPPFHKLWSSSICSWVLLRLCQGKSAIHSQMLWCRTWAS